MRMMLTAALPTNLQQPRALEAGNDHEADSRRAEAGGRVFRREGGSRCAILVIDVPDQSRIPFFAEPFFLKFNASCRFRIAMTAEDLGKAGLEALGKKWK